MTAISLPPSSRQVLGSPSQDLSEKMSVEEKERIRKQREELGEDGLKIKAIELKKAIEQNEVFQGCSWFLSGCMK